MGFATRFATRFATSLPLEPWQTLPLAPQGLQAGDASRGSSTEFAIATLLLRGDASRGSSTESARATLLRGGDASRGSSTESARATLLQRGDASRGSSTKSARETSLQRGDATPSPSVPVFACNRAPREAKCSVGVGDWTTQWPRLPLFTQQPRTQSAETLVGMGKSRSAVVRLLPLL